MYQNIDGTITISVNDWCRAGLTYKQFNHDSNRGFLKIFRRGIHGNTLIDVRSIKRPERLRAIEDAYGKLETEAPKSIYHMEISAGARSFFINYRKPDGLPLEPEQIEEYVNRASILEAIKRGMEKQIEARAKAGKRLKKGKFWEAARDWYLEQIETYPCPPISNPRTLERLFKEFLKGGYEAIIHKNVGNDAARLVSVPMERLLISLWRTNDKPFISQVHQLYLDFVAGSKELFDKSTGEVFHPEDFRHKGRALEISEATVWNYLKNVVNETTAFPDRNGNFEYMNTRRPKHHRRLGRYSLSKVSMDDVCLSRKSVRGWVYRYIAVDVVSGYWFRPAYIVGKPSHDTVLESFRNMFCELNELGLPMPGELEVENHLMKDLDWLNELFPFVRFCQSSTEKRAEHKIKALKYGTSKRNRHTRGRWYAKHEAWRTVRNKKSGDFIEPEYQPQTIIADDLADIEEHNNELHPLQKTYPGMTRKEVFIQNFNPTLKPIDNWYLYRFIGNETQTSIYNNDYCPVQNEEFELKDFNSLKRLKANNTEITAYWLPDEEGAIKEAYLYQGETYIGEAVNRADYAYNECAIERTDADEDAMLHQNKRLAKYDSFFKHEKSALHNIEYQDIEITREMLDVETDVIPDTPEPELCNYEDLDFESTNWREKARTNL